MTALDRKFLLRESVVEATTELRCLWGGAVGISQGALIKGDQDGVVAKEVSERLLRVVRSAGLIAFDATDANSPAPQAWHGAMIANPLGSADD